MFVESGRWRVTGGQILGDRLLQEDRFASAEPNDPESPVDLYLFLADGMGGHEGGAQAAELAMDAAVAVAEHSSDGPATTLVKALEAANSAIKAVAEYPGMGCTFLGVALAGADIVFISVGDSLILHGGTNGLTRLNADHSLAGLLDQQARAGEITPEQAAGDPRRHQLRSAVTGSELALIDMGDGPVEMVPGERLILASDGLLALPVEEVVAIAQASATPEEMTAAVLQAVRGAQNEGLDNTTVVVAEFDQRKRVFGLFS